MDLWQQGCNVEWTLDLAGGWDARMNGMEANASEVSTDDEQPKKSLKKRKKEKKKNEIKS